MIEWGIKKIFTMTVDNASSNDTAVAHLKKKISNKNAFVMDGEYFHIRCCAHIINLIVKDGMKEEGGSVEKIRAVVRYIRASPQRSEQFKICCERDENPYKNNLVLDVPTRWNYTYLMLETALKFQKSIERYEESDPFFAVEIGINSPTSNDWKNAQVFCKFLKTFFEVTKKLSGSLYVTSNSYFHDIMTIQSTIYSWSNSRDPVLKNMADRMSLKFDKYWGCVDKINMLLLIAVVMDPRYKLKLRLMS
uniref:hAT-like transposase RNase-H fold domain-containing protein n=1 Tax=Kalanchoe fedtschenkoi TaxID=63787 RepID=A0A7N0VCY4_KALFE